MKKNSVIDTLIKAGIAAAAIGGTVFLLKDRIEENPKCKDAVDKVKNKVKSLVPSKEKPIEEDDFFDDDFDDIIHTSSSERGYVNIKFPDDKTSEEEAFAEDAVKEAAAEELEEDAVKEAAAKELEEDAVEDSVAETPAADAE